MAKTLESLYGCRNNRFVSPISFAQSLIGYVIIFCNIGSCKKYIWKNKLKGAIIHFRFYITGSKSALTLSTKGSPSGSYSTVQNWIADQGKQHIQCPQHADVVTFLTIIRYPNALCINIYFLFPEKWFYLFLHIKGSWKKWKVEVNYKSATSVITTTVHIVPDDKQQLQVSRTVPKTPDGFFWGGKEANCNGNEKVWRTL